jgi:hypothetical protein
VERSAGSMILGRLELIREETASVGVQVFGPTWAVLDHETGELARTCVIDAELLPDAASRAAFVAGLSPLSSLRDPTLVPQLFVGVDELGGAVLYEPLPGGVAFDDLFDGTGSYELTLEVGRLARQLARALAALHARGHVHGMLASPGVFVGPRGPAVYQYGLAPLCDRSVLMRRARAFGLINLAPEVMAGGDFTATADLYAWAVTIAQFAAGVRGPAALEVVRGNDELAGVTPGLRAALQACLVADPGARPRDGADLLRMIDAAGRGEGSGMLARADIPDDAGTSEPPVAEEPVTEEPPTMPEPASGEAPSEILAPTAATAPASPRPPSPSVPKDRMPTIPPTGMSLPVTSFEEMLMSGDRARRPATIAPGSMSVAALHEEPADVVRAAPTSGKSANNLRRVHVLTDPVKRGPGESSGVTPVRSELSGDQLIGGTREEVEAASRATTVRLDSFGIAEAVRTANVASPDAEPVPAVTKPSPPPPPPPRPASAAVPAARPASAAVPAARPASAAVPAAARPASAAAPAAARPASAAAPAAARPASAAAPAAARPASAAVPAAPRPAAPDAAATDIPEKASGSGSRRRSSALSMSGHGEPRDWGTIPPIKDLLPTAPSVAPPSPAPVTALEPSPARTLPLPVIVAVGLAALLVLVLWLT